MSDTLGDDALQKLASLAQLVLTAEEQPRYARDLQAILKYVDKLQECDTTDVPPLTRAGEAGVGRPDEARPGLSLETALRNAPERIGDGFGVPKIIE